MTQRPRNREFVTRAIRFLLGARAAKEALVTKKLPYGGVFVMRKELSQKLRDQKLFTFSHTLAG